MSGFIYRKNVSGITEAPPMLQIMGANNVVFQRNDAIRVNTSGFGALVTAGDVTLGILAGVCDKNGSPVAPDSGTLDTWTMPSDNQTVAMRKAMYIPALASYLFFNKADGSMAQTNLFQFADLNDENDVATGTFHDSTVSQVRLVELDPDNDADATKGLFQFVETFWSQSNGSGGIEA